VLAEVVAQQVEQAALKVQALYSRQLHLLEVEEAAHTQLAAAQAVLVVVADGAVVQVVEGWLPKAELVVVAMVSVLVVVEVHRRLDKMPQRVA